MCLLLFSSQKDTGRGGLGAHCASRRPQPSLTVSSEILVLGKVTFAGGSGYRTWVQVLGDTVPHTRLDSAMAEQRLLRAETRGCFYVHGV